TALQDDVLAALARELDLADADASARFERAYLHALARQRELLWSSTIDDPAFRCAVALSSPTLATAAVRRRASARTRSDKRTRHLETSLYRYLARAVGRPEPCGLWAGVALARWTDRADSSSARIEPGLRVEPELGPLRAAYRALCARAPYRDRGRFRVNQTLRETGGVWHFARPCSAGAPQWATLPDNPVLSSLLELECARTSQPLADITEELARRVGAETATVLLDLLRREGLLVGGLGFPARYSTATEAVIAIERTLESDHADAWRSCRLRVQASCDALAQRLAATLAGEPGADVDDVLATDREVRCATAELVAALGLPEITLPATMLRVDLLAPVGLELGTDDREAIERTLADWMDTERREHTIARYVRRADAVLEGRSAVEVFARGVPGAASPRRSDEPHSGPPAGALVLRPGPAGLADAWIRGLSDSPTATHARHAAALRDRDDPLLGWFQRLFVDLRRDTGIDAVDLVVERVESPNVLARPDYVATCIDPWGTRARELQRDALVVEGPTRAAPIVLDGGRALAAFTFTAAANVADDAVLARLLATSFSALAEPRLRPVATAGDAARSRRRTTAQGRAVVPARIDLSTDETSALVTRRGARRFVQWLACARAHDWPALVRVVRNGQPAVLVPTHSPLAVAAVLEGIRAGDRIRVEEVLDAGWIRSEHGTHVTEIVVPVRRTAHVWQRRRAEREEGCDVASG
ncbi:MAG TPA: lantibiotic dehydratase, partial [Nannocystaceae bacterium]|nr:lantibiotic dehydratase [Nannocystaceae bacterium]